MDRVTKSVETKSKGRSRHLSPMVAAIPRAWCVEINTAFPDGRYYFGPFNSRKEAEDSRSSYVEKLCRTAARGIVALVKPDRPDELQSSVPLKGAIGDATMAQYGTAPRKWF